MGYTPQHKDRTRQRIIGSAGRLFRRYGYNGVGIDDIMAAAHLTRGGFYAHFKSKQDLFAAAMAEELILAREFRRRGAEGGEAPSVAVALIEYYLGSSNRGEISRLCPLVSLSADVSRAGGEVSAAYTKSLRDLAGEIARHIPGEGGDRDSRAWAAIALCVGGVVLAHAVDDEGLADTILSACRERAVREGVAPVREEGGGE